MMVRSGLFMCIGVCYVCYIVYFVGLCVGVVS